MNLNECYNLLVELAYNQDYSKQREWISVITTQRNISVDYLMSRKCLFIPNEHYITDLIGESAQSPTLGFYFNGELLWQLYFIFPVTDLTGTIVGISGWDAYSKFKVETSEKNLSLPMYKVSNSSIMDKGAYFMCDHNLLREQFSKRVIFVVDGVFDGLSLSEKGIPNICLLGSNITQSTIYFLGFYNYIYVLHDNDDAGIKLYHSLKRKLPNVYRITQVYTKDIEELLRDDENGISNQLQTLLGNPIKGDINLIV